MALWHNSEVSRSTNEFRALGASGKMESQLGASLKSWSAFDEVRLARAGVRHWAIFTRHV